ncbi:MAG: methyltransferase FkbM family [Hyphomicrobiales bacterium]|nr:methyltransferase FkbM family [Hyphomicrobiales bacterium]
MLQKLSALPKQLVAVCRHPLNRGQKLQALGRWARWQVASRVSARPMVVPFVSGTSLYARAGETGISGNIYYGLAEYEDMAFALHLLRPGDLFVDVGANAGAYSVLAAGAAGARTIAFEPIAETADRFDANMRLNRLTALVTLRRVGVGAAPGVLRFTASSDTVNHVALAHEAAVEVPVETLDQVFETEPPTLMKIDVEGFEAEVLAGGRQTLRNPALLALIVEINDSYQVYGRSLDDVVGPILDAGFAPFAYDPAMRELRELPGPNLNSGNTIFIRSADVARARLRSAPGIKLRSARPH